jgi:hypothetical protein
MWYIKAVQKNGGYFNPLLKKRKIKLFLRGIFMRRKSILAVGATLALAATAMGSNFTFPSPWNPAGRPASEVTQMVTITWDDNAYSGLSRTGYEVRDQWEFDESPNGMVEGRTAFQHQHFVDWLQPDPAAPAEGTYGNMNFSQCIGWTELPNDTWNACRPNAEGITEAGPVRMGMNWALNLNSQAKMTFFMLSGLYVDVVAVNHGAWDATNEPHGWQAGRSRAGWWTGEEIGQPWVNPRSGYRTLPTAWGREHGVNVGRTVPVGAAGNNQIPTSGGSRAQFNTITRVSHMALELGHEIADHSIDHMETNTWIMPSGAPFNQRYIAGQWGAGGFSRWDNEGWRPTAGTANNAHDMTDWGQPVNLTNAFGTTGANLNRGWRTFAGRQLSQAGWTGAIRLSNDWIMNTATDQGGLGLSTNNRGILNSTLARGIATATPQRRVYGWRAPRLESNSNMFFALSALGYRYDSSLEDGFEMHVTGENMLWPFTLDNGTRNSWTQADRGSRVFHDTMPAGLWQIPINVVIVPENIRPAVIDNWNMINDALNETGIGQPNRRSADGWDGKITAFDFNVFIHYAMTPEQFTATMNNTLGLRRGATGNRAPFNWGTHTDYYTPVYDRGTLMNGFNRNNYGLVLTRNTWKTRISATEAWVSSAISSGVRFVTAMELIDTMIAMTIEGENRIEDNHSIPTTDFTLQGGIGMAAGTPLANGTLMSGLQAGPNSQGNQPRFVLNLEGDNRFDRLTHISLDYISRTATAVRLILADPREESGEVIREVILAHRYSPIGWSGHPNTNFETAFARPNFGGFRNSGKIPLSSFDFDQYFTGTRNYTAINPANIKRVEILPLAPANVTPVHGQWGAAAGNQTTGGMSGGEFVSDNPITHAERTAPFDLAFAIRNIQFHTGEVFDWGETPDLPPPAGITSRVGRAGTRAALSIAGLTTNSLRLNIAQAGTYNIGIYTVNGRQIQSFRGETLSAGMNTLNLNNLARGVHVVRIQGVNNNQQLVRQVIVR